MKENTAQRLNQIMSERNLRQIDILKKSEKFQKELGIKLGKSALSQYVSGKSVPDQDKLVLLAKTLGVSESWLMGYDPVPKDQNIIHGDNNGLNSYNNSSVTINQGTSKENFDRSHDQQIADFELQKEILSYLDKQTEILNQLLLNTEKILVEKQEC